MGEYEREQARRGRAGAKLIYLGCDGGVLVGEEGIEEKKAVAVRCVFRPADDELRMCACVMMSGGRGWRGLKGSTQARGIVREGAGGGVHDY